MLEEDVWVRTVIDDQDLPYLAQLWAKSGFNRRTKTRTARTLLLQHLLDAVAVGELLWDQFLAPILREEVDALSGGSGREFFAWLCGVHDLGKATPAFQSQDPELAELVRSVGLEIRTQPGAAQKWRHELASAQILRERLGGSWREESAVDWIWPLAAGHHGQFPSMGKVAKIVDRRRPRDRQRLHGSDPGWERARTALVHAVTVAAGFDDLRDVEPDQTPSRATQLALSGFIVMADWIASNDHVLGPVSDIGDVSLIKAHERATRAIAAIGLGQGLSSRRPPADICETAALGVNAPRPLQEAMYSIATEMGSPGLIVCEAPTGEGKTEAALVAAEVLASRFGADGVFVALPTQATANAMLDRVVPWLDRLDAGTEFALVHGGRATSRKWQEYRASRADHAVSGATPHLDEYGLPGEFLGAGDMSVLNPFSEIGTGYVDTDHTESGSTDGGQLTAKTASEWFTGHKRGLLARNGVGTIDQLLYAGTRTKHVMLRYAGLAGKVVIIDEVHAVDTYMATFLNEVMAWLGLGRIPVVLLSATLAPSQRVDLIASYLKGALLDPNPQAEWALEMTGHPRITSVWASSGEVEHRSVTTNTWRRGQAIRIERVDEVDSSRELEAVTEVLEEALDEGGCALVIRNTVVRAVEAYDLLVDRFGEHQVRLLHGRLASGHRAELTDQLVSQLGPRGVRPERLIVVATQVAEQSFDVDVDVLISDLAPIDLLIQRAGRMHRHPRPASDRPSRVREPRLVLTGLDLSGEKPWFPPASGVIYGDHLLLRSAAAILQAVESGGIVLPDDAPDLVAAVYGNTDLVPSGWAEFADEAEACWSNQMTATRADAQQYVLVSKGTWTEKTLAGLHDYPAGVEEAVRVRDGDMGTEVVLVSRDDDGYRTIDGDRLGVNAERVGPGLDYGIATEMTHRVLAGTVRIPGAAFGSAKKIGDAAEALSTLSGWSDNPMLGNLHVLELDERLRGELGGITVRYDRIRGLLVGSDT